MDPTLAYWMYQIGALACFFIAGFLVGRFVARRD